MAAKRFKVCDYPTGRVLEDIVNHKELDDIDYVCGLLNELHEENKHLKHELMIVKDKLKGMMNDV